MDGAGNFRRWRVYVETAIRDSGNVRFGFGGLWIEYICILPCALDKTRRQSLFKRISGSIQNDCIYYIAYCAGFGL